MPAGFAIGPDRGYYYMDTTVLDIERNDMNRMMALLLAGLIPTALVGCVSVKAPKEVNIGGDKVYDRDGRRDDDWDDDRDDRPRHDDRREKVDKDEAYRIANKLAHYENLDPKDYEVHDKGINDARWVLFEHRRPRRRDNWRNHLAVRVGPYGRSRVYARDFERFPAEWDRRKVKKDDAYHIAKGIARNLDVKYFDEYDIHDKEIGDVYWVLFEHKHPKRKYRWRNFFTIRVGPYGDATFYPGDR